MLSRRHLFRRTAVLACIGLALVSASSCNSPQLGSPTLPLPPPEIARDGERYVLSGTVPAERANVFARNESTLHIFGEYTTSRNYSFPVDAAPGDYFTMWYSVGLEQSPPSLVEIPAEVADVEPLPGADAGVPGSNAGE